MQPVVEFILRFRALGVAGRPLVAAFCVAATVSVLGVALAQTALARTRTSSIEELEAAYLYQFTRYVEWPSSSFDRTDDAFVIAIVGDEAVYDAMSELVSGQDTQGRVVRVDYVSDPEDLQFGQIVYVAGDNQWDLLAGHQDDFGGQALTVGVHEDFTREGGIMRLYKEDSRLRIEVNIDAAKRSDLKISSKLLGLARIVKDEGN